jgi:hypothetical protein
MSETKVKIRKAYDERPKPTPWNTKKELNFGFEWLVKVNSALYVLVFFNFLVYSSIINKIIRKHIVKAVNNEVILNRAIYTSIESKRNSQNDGKFSN